MNTKILAVVIAAALVTSCSSLYKATSTPDDIYYTPSASTVKTTSTDVGYDRYENYQSSTEDQYLRMKVQNPTLWGTIDDYSYWNDSRYDYGYSCNSSRTMLLTSLYNPYGYSGFFGRSNFGYGGFGYGWNNWGSPYQTVVLYKNPTVYNNTNKSNLTAYHNIQYNNTNRDKYTGNGYNSGNGYQNGSYTTRGSSYNANNGNSNYVPARSFSSSSSSNSAGGRSGGFSSTGSSAGSSRATRH